MFELTLGDFFVVWALMISIMNPGRGDRNSSWIGHHFITAVKTHCTSPDLSFYFLLHIHDIGQDGCSQGALEHGVSCEVPNDFHSLSACGPCVVPSFASQMSHASVVSLDFCSNL